MEDFSPSNSEHPSFETSAPHHHSSHLAKPSSAMEKRSYAPVLLGQCLTNGSGVIIRASAEFAFRVGIEAEMLVGKSILDFFIISSSTRLPHFWTHLIESSSPVSCLLHGGEGHAYPVQVHALGLPANTGWSLSFLFSEGLHKHPEEKEQIAVGGATLNLTGQILSYEGAFEQALQECFGFQIEEEPLYRLLLMPESRLSLRGQLIKGLLGQASEKVYPNRYQEATRWWSWHLVPETLDGQVVGMSLSIREYDENQLELNGRTEPGEAWDFEEDVWALSTNLILAFSDEGVCKHANPAAHHMLHRSEDLMVGKTLKEIVFREDLEVADGLLQQAVKGELPKEPCMIRFICPGGEVKSLLIRVHYLVNLNTVFWVGEDLTEQIQEAAYLRMLETYVTYSHDMVVITSPGFTREGNELPVMFVNEALLEVMEVEQGRVLGRNLLSILPEVGTGELAANIRAALSAQEGYFGEGQLQTYSGRSFWAEIRMVPSFGQNNSLQHYIFVIRDISFRKKLRYRRALRQPICLPW